ncbi:MAG: carboxypeptidase-like regulatory domain-containing protein, partial [Spirochaetales bacterium]|nr:carboxypeptidase-like regulatory domain-containing protein [Spirochaetales bacterium]
MNRAIVTFTFFLFGISCFAQTEIRGKVLDNKNRNPIVAATVILHPVGLQDILTYGTTGEDGSFVLNKAVLPDTVVISVRSMNTEPFSIKIKSNIEFVELTVTEKTIALNEVIVKPAKIRQIGDTLNYSVSSFVDVTDKSIGDVLKKLPGIQVLSTGQILYQNKAI